MSNTLESNTNRINKLFNKLNWLKIDKRPKVNLINKNEERVEVVVTVIIRIRITILSIRA